jgi:NAD(P)H dehydrogenase (quinone)
MKAIHLTAYGNPAQNLKMVNVRPTVFLENPFFYGFAAESIRRTGELQLPFAAGKSSPIAAQDVARVMAEILISPGVHLGRIYELTGPKAQGLAQSPRNIRRDSDGR